MTIGVVVIGRNVERTLPDALRSALQETEAVVYADSGSQDGSREVAAGLGVDVVALDDSAPHTAARGRNAGFDRLLARHPGVEFVQFLDGDTCLAPGWITAGRSILTEDSSIGVVAGVLRERERERNVYHRLADLEWRHPPGDTASVGGNMMVRHSVWSALNGMEASLRAGEEREFCLRVKGHGKRVVYVGHPMASHDIGCSSFGTWWRRSERAGHAYAETAWREGIFQPGGFGRRVLSAMAWGAVVPTLALAGAPGTLGASVVGAAALYGSLWLRVRRSRSRQGDAPDDAAVYATFCVLSKFAEAGGAARFGFKLAKNVRP